MSLDPEGSDIKKFFSFFKEVAMPIQPEVENSSEILE